MPKIPEQLLLPGGERRHSTAGWADDAAVQVDQAVRRLVRYLENAQTVVTSRCKVGSLHKSPPNTSPPPRGTCLSVRRHGIASVHTLQQQSIANCLALAAQDCQLQSFTLPHLASPPVTVAVTVPTWQYLARPSLHALSKLRQRPEPPLGSLSFFPASIAED